MRRITRRTLKWSSVNWFIVAMPEFTSAKKALCHWQIKLSTSKSSLSQTAIMNRFVSKWATCLLSNQCCQFHHRRQHLLQDQDPSRARAIAQIHPVATHRQWLELSLGIWPETGRIKGCLLLLLPSLLAYRSQQLACLHGEEEAMGQDPVE